MSRHGGIVLVLAALSVACGGNSVDQKKDRGAPDTAEEITDEPCEEWLAPDLDGDGVGTVAELHCPEQGWVPSEGDCDDANPSVFPGADELCNGLDDDCDDELDEDFDFVELFEDLDGDGFGTEQLSGCMRPGFALVGGDCDDEEPLFFPGAPELCDGIDGDCDQHHDRELAVGDHETLGCDLCPEIEDPIELISRSLNPCVLDPSLEHLCADGITAVDTHMEGERLHRVRRRSGLSEHRDELLVFFPAGPGEITQRLPEIYARAGYKTVSLVRVGFKDRYLAGCPSPSSCLERSQELLDGVDRTPEVDIPYGESVEGDLAGVLSHMHAMEPSVGWDQHLTSGGGVAWSTVHAMGWSGVGESLGVVAREKHLASAIGIATPLSADIYGGEIWETPLPALRLISHVGEVSRFAESWLGLEPYLLMDSQLQTSFSQDAWPWPEGELLISNTAIPAGCDAHMVVARDSCMPDDIAGAHHHLACSVGRD